MMYLITYQYGDDPGFRRITDSLRELGAHEAIRNGAWLYESDE
jgi:hypothetical protein